MFFLIHGILDIHGIYGLPCISLTMRKCNRNFNKTWQFVTHLVNSFFWNLQDHFHPLIRVTLLHESNTGNFAPIKDFYCIPAVMASSKTWKVKLRLFMDEYIDDMVDPTSLDADINLWCNLWLNSQVELPQDVKKVLERKPKCSFAKY